MARVYLFGASGHGKVIKEIVESNGDSVTAFIDDDSDVCTTAGLPVLHDATGLSPIIVSIGSNSVRKLIAERLCSADAVVEFSTAIHPSAIVSSSAQIGEGSVVMAGAVINADVIIGKHCIINTGATVDHDCVIEDYCHIAPGAHISGGTQVGEGTWIGVGASVIQCLHIGCNCMIGAGSVVVCDIPDGVTAYGNPCKIRKYKDNTMKHQEQNPIGGGGNVVFALSTDTERRMSHAA